MEVKVKPVELIELFYDLIFVYAISKLTALVSEPVGGIIPLNNFFAYIITSFVILQAWLYFTNYVNRYGKWEWHDYALVCVNMIAVIYMANTISPNWTSMSFTFNLSMLIMLLTVVILYVIQARRENSLKGAAGNSISILSIVCTIYLIAIVALIFNLPANYVILIDVVAVLGGAFLPFFIRGNFDKSIISFPHLVERFELLTIITFGEAIVGLTHFFDVGNFSLVPILVFFIVLTMFGSYVIQIHYLMEHHRVERSLRLMFSHYFIVISINLVTVALELIHSGEVNPIFATVLMIVSLVIFYISLMANKQYYKENIKLTKRDILLMLLVTCLGIIISLIFISNLYAFLIGSLIITFGNFKILLTKYKGCLSE
ncbi:MAG: low temperature requirement protein A [Methanobrevibacter sp.]|uniref:low temperature requirement protein A n=1 Tax=Methanobrevibacter sp. TaxID=66852 RepID=UPI0025E00404|nr:low temperature requirement protein A [Methanobrevibacter sp.]MBE6508198.1 low temperature requirement protein A [Methanobrevibacter sp.]